MSAIKVLHPDVVKKIAAGEVVERPASIVKELVENSIDAGASSVSIEIKGGGIAFIRVADNGCGMAKEDIPAAFLRHATSKIEHENDLERIHTLGFRGEALFSIAAVSHVELESKQASSQTGYRIVARGGEILERSAFACSDGTGVTIRNVFFNMPARLKFLKSTHQEAAAIGDTVTKLILGNPHIAFRFSVDGREMYHSPGNGDVKAAIHAVYGADTVRSLIPVEHEDGGLRLHGYVGAPQNAQHNRSRQHFYVNGRYVEFAGASFSVQQAFGERLMVRRYPFYVMYLDVDDGELDVNVHPQKLNVRFSNEKAVKDFIFCAISGALKRSTNTASVQHADALNEPFSDNDHTLPWESVEQPQTSSNTEDKTVPSGRAFTLPEKGDAADELRELLVEGRSRQGTSRILRETASIGEKGDTLISTGITNADYDYIVIGQAFDTYLIVQTAERLLLIDQHAAHERILYDRFMEAIARGKAASQSLLIPYILHLAPNEYAIFQSHVDILHSIGFIAEEFGGYSIRVSAVPHLLGQPQLPAFFDELLSSLDEIRQMDSAALKKAAIIRLACRKAIKAGDKLHAEEIQTILDQYDGGQKQLTCPHGRPIVLAIEKRALEKGFRRLV